MAQLLAAQGFRASRLTSRALQYWRVFHTGLEDAAATVTETIERTDVLVIGAGIAGLSLAATLAPHCQVVVLERESHPGYHSTGRSAAYFSPALGNEVVQALTIASGEFFRKPEPGFTEVPLLHPRDALHLFPKGARMDAEEPLLGREATACVTEVSVRDAAGLWPVLREGYLAGAALERGGGDLDVDALLQGYRRALLRAGGNLVTGAEVLELTRAGAAWHCRTGRKTVHAKLLVNAAGAWGDEVASAAGVAPIGLTPLRRTAMVLPLASGIDARSWPFVVQGTEHAPFYVRPDAGALMLSAADEQPDVARDAQPEELDVAQAVDRLQRASTLRFEQVTRAWAGLRTFAPDRTFVVGFDCRQDDFFWCVGQGGYGVQTAPALARLGACVLLEALRPAAAQGLALSSQSSLARAVDPGRFSSRHPAGPPT
ncbi:MAG: FAD-binding oxidoreductase [Pseudomonadota bacterium]